MSAAIPVVPGDKLVTRLSELQADSRQNTILRGQGVWVTTTPQGTQIEVAPGTGDAGDSGDYIPRLG